MNKKWLMTAGVIGVGAVLGLSVFQSSADSIEPALSNENVIEQLETQYPGKVTEFELEEEDGSVVYEIEIEGDGIEFELEVDGATGEIVKEKVERKEKKAAEKTEMPVTEQEETISLDEAKAIALQKFDGTVKEIEFEKDDGRYEYSFEIKNGKEEAEIEIDGVTGKIIEFEIERE